MLFGREFLSRMEFKFRRYAIRNLMTVIVFITAFVYLATIASNYNLIYYLFYAPQLVIRGEIWRFITFIFIPPPVRYDILMIFVLYFYWWMGTALERDWGAFKFNAFYLCGILGTLIAGTITGFATNEYLNLSLLFAIAILYPEHEIRLMLIIPVKMKFLGLLNAALFIYMFITYNSAAHRLALIAAVINIIIFFGGDFMNIINQAKRRAEWRRKSGGWFR